jgi:hypothetical protein
MFLGVKFYVFDVLWCKKVDFYVYEVDFLTLWSEFYVYSWVWCQFYRYDVKNLYA